MLNRGEILDLDCSGLFRPVEECRQVGLSHGRHDQFKMYPFNYHVRPLSKSCSRIALGPLGSCEPLEQVAQSHMPLPTHQEYLETLSKIYPPPFPILTINLTPFDSFKHLYHSIDKNYSEEILFFLKTEMYTIFLKFF